MNWDYVSKLQKSCAFIPCYLKGTGKATKIYYKEGGCEHINYSINKVINDYFNINMRSIQSIKRYCGRVTGKKSITPLYLKDDCILIPIKTLKPCTRGDRCIGYVNTEHILTVDFTEQLITLKNGNSIVYMDCNETIKKRIADCAIIKQSVKLNNIV